MSGWTVRAAQAQQTLLERYWNPTLGVFEHRTPPEPHSGPFHYWWMAHALDTLLDAFERDGDLHWLEQVDVLLGGVLRHNGGQIVNDYYDDMAWMALALLRAHDLGGREAHRQAVLTLWREIQGGWNAHMGGGFAWRKPQPDYKNTPANAPAALLAARLYARFGDPADLEWACQTHRWLEAHLVDPESGFVWDGLNREGDARIDLGWAFTYNQGTYVGASLALGQVTGQTGALEQARRTARATRARLAHPQTLELPDEGGGDAGLFKGILIRHLLPLASEDPAVLELIERNALMLWASRGPEGLFGPSWSQPARSPHELSSHLSGVMLLEAMAQLERAGMLERHSSAPGTQAGFVPEV